VRRTGSVVCAEGAATSVSARSWWHAARAVRVPVAVAAPVADAGGVSGVGWADSAVVAAVAALWRLVDGRDGRLGPLVEALPGGPVRLAVPPGLPPLVAPALRSAAPRSA
jgi:hypothetical protein